MDSPFFGEQWKELKEKKLMQRLNTRLKCHMTGPHALLMGMLKDMKKREMCGVSLGN